MKTTPATAATQAAARHDITLTATAAFDIADAVLASYDREITLKQQVDRHRWEIPDFRQDFRAELRRRLFNAVADKDCLPTALPAESLAYLPPGHWMPGSEAPEVPTALAESGDAPWESVRVTLSMPVRKAM